MAFIRVRSLERDPDGIITRGSASIVESVYDPHAKGGHCRQQVIERLGGVLWLSDDRREGIFASPTRGVVRYDSKTSEFSEADLSSLDGIDRSRLPPPFQSHTHFGDIYLLVGFMRDIGLLSAFRTVFAEQAEYERFIVHLSFELLREGSHEKCDTFFRQSAIPPACESVMPHALRSDTVFFEMMGTPNVKKSMFAALVEWMRGQEPDFGSACHVDSSPLPNDPANNPYNALRCQPATGCAIEDRLALVLDQDSGVPVWYEVLAGNRADLATLDEIITSVRANLGIEVDGLVLDSGHVSGSLLERYNANATDRRMIARMPGRSGYPRRQLYEAAKPLFRSGDHALERNGHLYFGGKFKRTIQKQPVFAYVFVDWNNANAGAAGFLRDNEEEFLAMAPEEKDWRLVMAGFLVLLSNIDATPDKILWEYIDRASVEAIFKDSKTFLRLLPIAKWNERTVLGKLLLDIVAEVVRTRLLESLPKYRRDLSDLFVEAQIVDCYGVMGSTMLVDSGNKQAKGAFKVFGKSIPGRITKNTWKALILGA